jgi:3-deoxy-D-manno-octulosonic-acid transferase
MYFIYTLALTLGLFAALPYYLVRFRKYLPTVPDRLGFPKLPQLEGAIWIHAVSVGEVKAVEKLLEGLKQQYPGKPLVVSTVTPAGQALARQRRDIIDYTFYFPIDLPWCVRRALDRVRPQIVVIAETEIWPNFLRACRTRAIHVVMINGRISDRSFSRYRLIRRWLRRVFEDYTIIGMQSDLDRHRIEAIGADPQKVTVFGNLKYDVAGSNRPVEGDLAEFLREWNPIWIAASTMPGEEEFILDAFADLSRKRPELKLIIAPRHPDRSEQIQQMVNSRGFTCVRRTRFGTAANVLLLDTIGELAGLFQYATVVFIGGSLVSRGGHNVLEPARYRKPIVFGPHMENFRDIARLFLNADAAIQIKNSGELAPAIDQLLSAPKRAEQLGSNAHAIVLENTGATDRVLERVQPIGAGR